MKFKHLQNALRLALESKPKTPPPSQSDIGATSQTGSAAATACSTMVLWDGMNFISKARSNSLSIWDSTVRDPIDRMAAIVTSKCPSWAKLLDYGTKTPEVSKRNNIPILEKSHPISKRPPRIHRTRKSKKAQFVDAPTACPQGMEVTQQDCKEVAPIESKTGLLSQAEVAFRLGILTK
jgi:hypothetical protein